MPSVRHFAVRAAAVLMPKIFSLQRLCGLYKMIYKSVSFYVMGKRLRIEQTITHWRGSDAPDHH